MIIYDLCCEQEHRFEGWFRSAEDFDAQLESGLVHCPHCETPSVRRVPSAVAIGSSASGEKPVAANTSVGGGGAAIMPGGAQVRALYRQLVEAIVSQSEDVGKSFADEARKIHYHEAPERSIRGQASAEECEALRDEGIEILQLPVVKDEELN